MPLARKAKPFSHPKWLFEIKHDGFRALAFVEKRSAILVSRRRNIYKTFPSLCQAIGNELQISNAVLDGEIVSVDGDGRSQFNPLFYRRGDFFFYGFDLLWLNGQDLRSQPLVERKEALRRIIPPQPSRVLYCSHIHERGEELFQLACERDLEGIVAKKIYGAYSTDPEHTTWIKIKNPAYTQMQGRREQFENRRARFAQAG